MNLQWLSSLLGHFTEREHVRGEGTALYNPSIHSINTPVVSERKGLMVSV